MRRILIYTHEFPPFAGGAGTHATTLAKGLSRLGVDVTVLAPDYGGDQSALDRGVGFSVRRFERWEAKAPWSHRALWKALVARRAEHLILLDRVAQEQFAELERPLCRYSLVVHGTEILEFFAPSHRKRESPQLRRLFEKADWIFANSRSTAGLLLTFVPELKGRVSVAYCAVDPDRLAHQRPPDGARYDSAFPGKTVVLTVGRLDVDKGHDVLLPAFAAVARRAPDAVLVIAGSGPLEGEVGHLISQLGLESRVVLAGKVSDADLASLYRRADVFVLASRATRRVEGFGIVFLEAGLFGLPVIGGDTGGVPEAIVEGETGFVVGAEEPTQLADRLARLLDDEGLRKRLGEAGRARVLGEFLPERLGRDVLATLRARRGRSRGASILWSVVAGYGAYFLTKTIAEKLRRKPGV